MTGGWTAACADGGPPTPFLALHHPRLLANVRDVAARVAAYGGHTTPHQKTHKSAEIAQAQVAAGATRATVATAAEAGLAFDAGFGSVLVAYPPVPGERTRALTALTERGRVAVTCSRPEHVRALAATGAEFDVYWEIDSGTGRLGTAPGRATADAVAAAPFGGRVALRGLLTFAGHAYAAADAAGLADVRDQQDDALSRTREALRDFGDLVLSVGVTPLARLESGRADEYRYGNYVFYDATQVALGAVGGGGPGAAECALAVISTVVDVPAPDRLVLDAGSKSLPAERMTPLTPGFGLVDGHPGIVVEKLYEEHGLAGSAEPHGLAPGDRVAVVPNHACTAVNLFTRYSVHDGTSYVDTWPIRARRT